MPELPEVQTVVTSLRGRVVGARVAAVRLARTDIVSPSGLDLAGLLAGRTIVAVDRRAKRIVFTLDDSNRFYVHLGMSGQLTVESPGAEVRKHTHLALELAGSPGIEVRFRDPRRFGGVFWLGQATENGELGPEPLTLRRQRLAKLLAGTGRAIKAALLDQRLIAGLGNIYVDESLFRARIHPLTPARQLSQEQLDRLNRAIKMTLRRAIAARGSTLRDYVDAANEPGAYRSQHQVYGRDGQPCRHCRTPIERIVVGGRSTCFCPTCQPTSDRSASGEKPVLRAGGVAADRDADKAALARHGSYWRGNGRRRRR